MQRGIIPDDERQGPGGAPIRANLRTPRSARQFPTFYRQITSMPPPAGAGSLPGKRLFPNLGGEHAERVIAYIRLTFAAVSLVVIYLDPTGPARYVTLTYALLGAYALYSLLLIAAQQFIISRPIVVAIHVGDVIAATILTLITEGPSSPFFVLFVSTLLAAGYRWGLWETLLTGIVSCLLIGVEAILTSDSLLPGGVVEGEFELNWFILRCTYLLLLAVMVGYAAEREKRARADAAVRGGAQERARMARELHDGVVQSLIGLKLQVRILRERSGDDSLEQIETMLEHEIVELRTLMFELTPVDEEPLELETLLADLIERFGRASGISARLVSAASSLSVSARTRREVARIVQEALINVRKHSRANHVLVSLSVDDEYCTLIVDDDGCGFDFEGALSQDALHRDRKGPRVIKERVRLLGGSLTIESHAGAGARLYITLPRQT